MKSNSFVNKEYFVIDLITLVGSIGGSLGLFIGFSFLDFGGLIIDFVCNKLELD